MFNLEHESKMQEEGFLQKYYYSIHFLCQCFCTLKTKNVL